MVEMIDTTSKKGDKKQKLTEADKIIQKIINDDEDMDEHISAYDLINHFKRYEESMRKFHISPDELFEKLAIKNKQIENFEMLEGASKA